MGVISPASGPADTAIEYDASEALMRSIVESSRDCIKVLSLEGQLLFMNAHGQRALGIEDFSLYLNRSYLDLWTDADRGACQVALDAARRGEPGSFEGYFPTSKGEPRWWSVAVSPIFDAQGTVTQLLAVSRNVTAAKKASAVIAETEERMRLAQEAANIGAWSLDLLHPESNYWSPEAYRLAATDPSWRPDYAEWLEYVHPADRERVHSAIQEALQGGAGFTVAYRFIGGDGVERWHEARGNVRRDSGGLPVAAHGITLDITDRKQAERALQESEQRLAALFSATSAVLWTADANGRFVKPQPSWEHYTGQRWPEYVDWGGMKALHPEDLPRAEAAWRRAIEFNEPYELEARFWHAATNEYRHTRGRAIPVRDPGGAVREWAGAFEDVHEGRLAEESLRKATEALRESEDHYRHTVELNPQVTWTANASGQLEDFSPRWLTLTGMSREEALTSGWTDVPHPDDLPAMMAGWTRSHATGQPFDLEHRIRVADGSYRWMRTRAQARRDFRGTVVRWYGTTEDIHDRKRAELELQRAKTQVENILNSIRESFIAVDREWRFTYVNERVAKTFGASRDELIGRLLWEVAPEASETAFRPAYERVMSERIPLQFEVDYPALGRWYEVHAYPTEEGLAAFVLDITGQHEAKEALRESEERYRFLAEALPQFVWARNAAGQIIYMNQHWIRYTGLTLEQCKAGDWVELVHPDDREALRAARRVAMAQGEFELEFRMRRASDGAYRWHLARGRPIAHADGEKRWIGTAMDVDDAKDAREALQLSNEALRRANADLEQFAYSASHDLQEPLRMVAIYSQLLQRRYQGKLDAEADRYLQFASGGARRMEALLTGLLAYTRALHGSGGIVSSVSGDAVLRHALTNLTEAVSESGASIESDSLPELQVEEIHLLQLFQNLIGNAIKYRGEAAPLIRIRCARDGCMWRISVADNGIGLDTAFSQQIFGLFKRLASADRYPGTGVGLAICQKIVERYGGRIWVESTGVGRGATFSFTLPAS